MPLPWHSPRQLPLVSSGRSQLVISTPTPASRSLLLSPFCTCTLGEGLSGRLAPRPSPPRGAPEGPLAPWRPLTAAGLGAPGLGLGLALRQSCTRGSRALPLRPRALPPSPSLHSAPPTCYSPPELHPHWPSPPAPPSPSPGWSFSRGGGAVRPKDWAGGRGPWWARRVTWAGGPQEAMLGAPPVPGSHARQHLVVSAAPRPVPRGSPSTPPSALTGLRRDRVALLCLCRGCLPAPAAPALRGLDSGRICRA